MPKQQLRQPRKLQDICDYINERIQYNGIDGLVADAKVHYEIANVVKINIWINDIKKQGVVKPMLLFYDGGDEYGVNTGDTRMRAIERIPSIPSFRSFISTSAQYRSKFQHLVEVTSFNQFAELCEAVTGQQFLFTLTDAQAPYGLFWFEYNSQRTTAITPGQDWCVDVFYNFYQQHNTTIFTPEWFDILVPWADYKSNN